MSLFNKIKTKKPENKIKLLKKEAEGTSKTQKGASSRNLFFSIKQPWITEKAGSLIDLRKYIFIVDKNINKPEIAKAVESIYNVKVSFVNIINKKGKLRRLGRSAGKVPGHKKAIVTLEKGHKIDAMPT